MKLVQLVFSIFCLVLPVTSFGLSASDPGVVPVQSISDHRWRDANTGKFITAPVSNPAPTLTSTPTTTATPTPMPTPTSTPATATATAAKKITPKAVGGAALGAVGLAAGTMGVIDSASGNKQHNWGDVAEGTISGATGAAMATPLINLIPGLGQIGYGITIASGAVIGGAVAGSQLFSETDCMNDPANNNTYTCCNTAFNKGERQVDIGGYMFCTTDGQTPVYGGVRQCRQGDSGEKQGSGFSQLWKDDAWSSDCIERYCDGYDKPASGLDGFIEWDTDKENICWKWDCVPGYTKVNNTCVSNGDGSIPQSYDIIIQKIEALRQQIISKCGAIE